ncbi:hypothetical protein [Nocardia abscessus]|uniref:hypothetical protein n=1 Tax=Nocardia abscessus TaxID=120957 RepID=UPI002453F4E2|nr:hypothetical protein [Nocardia abscessus]
MFEQRDRWLEELDEYTGRKDSITCTAGRMPLTAIVDEIANACADAREHTGQQIRDWQSMASDLSEAVDWVGPKLDSLVASKATAVHQTIMNQLLVTKNGKVHLDDSIRPAVAGQVGTLAAALDSDDALAAAWNDLVEACHDIDYAKYPQERVAYLRDTLVGLSDLRRQGRWFWSPMSTAVKVLFGYASSVRDAKRQLGDTVDPTTWADDIDKSTTLTDSELATLAERCIVQTPSTGDYVVWFRLHPAFVKSYECLTHGSVTFYGAQQLASALCDHERARKTFSVVPEELLTDEIREFQLSGETDEFAGFEYVPQLVYARVTVDGVERHRAVEMARLYLDTVLAVTGVPEKMWEVLDGTLLFGDNSYHPQPVDWGPKRPMPDPVFFENEFFSHNLSEMTADSFLITHKGAQQLEPVLALLAALKSVPREDPQAIVMAAVRAIEHCNTWVAPLGRYRWYAFAEEYLFDEYAVTALARRVGRDVFAAVIKYRPDRTPGAPDDPALWVIKQDIEDSGWSSRIDLRKSLPHLGTLRKIYAMHWLIRQLSETDDILRSTTALGSSFDAEFRLLDARVNRLTRSRNAAIHGGTLSTAACESIADFALTMGRNALNTVIRSIVTGEAVSTYATRQRDQYRRRIDNLRQGGDLKSLFSP